MKLITCFELASMPTSEIHALRRAVFEALIRSDPGSAERRNALASLDNLDTVIAARTPAP